MWKLIFGGVILFAIVFLVFFIGYVVGTTVTPLPPEGTAAALGVVTVHG